MEISINDIASAIYIFIFSISFAGIKDLLLRPDYRKISLENWLLIPQKITNSFFKSKFSSKIKFMIMGLCLYLVCFLVIAYIDNNNTWFILILSYVVLQANKLRNRSNSYNFITSRLVLTSIFLTLIMVVSYRIDYITALIFFIGMFIYVNKTGSNLTQSIWCNIIEILLIYKVLFLLVYPWARNSVLIAQSVELLLLLLTSLVYFFAIIYKRNFLKLNYTERSIILSLLLVVNGIYVYSI